MLTDSLRSMYLLHIAVIFALVHRMDCNILCNKLVVFDTMEQCEDEQHLDIIFRDIYVEQTDAETFVMSGELEFLNTITSPWQMRFDIKKCTKKGDPKSCEEFFVFDVKDTCKRLPEERQIWTKFVNATGMQKNCPIRKALYKLEDVPIDTRYTQFLPVSASYFRMKITSYSGGKTVLCVNCDFSVQCA